MTPFQHDGRGIKCVVFSATWPWKIAHESSHEVLGEGEGVAKISWRRRRKPNAYPSPEPDLEESSNIIFFSSALALALLPSYGCFSFLPMPKINSAQNTPYAMPALVHRYSFFRPVLVYWFRCHSTSPSLLSSVPALISNRRMLMRGPTSASSTD